MECEELHGTLQAAEKVAVQLRWKHHKHLRDIELERDKIAVREQSGIRVDEQQSRKGDRLRLKENHLQKEQRSSVDLRLSNVAELQHAREAHNLLAETIIFTRPLIFNLPIFICLLFLFNRSFLLRAHRRNLLYVWLR